MSQQAAVTLNTVVYSPAGSNNGLARWVNRALGVVGGFKVRTQAFKSPTTGTQTKIDFNLSIPVVADESSACVCAGDVIRTNSAVISVWVASTSTADERTDLYLQVKDLVASTVFQDAVKDLNPAYG